MIGSHKSSELSLFSNLGIDGGGGSGGGGGGSGRGGNGGNGSSVSPASTSADCIPAASESQKHTSFSSETTLASVAAPTTTTTSSFSSSSSSNSDSNNHKMYRNMLPLQISRPETKKNTITAEEISKYFHIPLNLAARKLGICPTYLKKLCRRNNIPSWPYRKLKSMEKRNMSEDDPSLPDSPLPPSSDSNGDLTNPKNAASRAKNEPQSPQHISHSSKLSPFQINGMVSPQVHSSPRSSSSDSVSHKSKSARLADSNTPISSSYSLTARNGNSSSSRIEQQPSPLQLSQQTSLAVPQICSHLQYSQMASSSSSFPSVTSPQAQLYSTALSRNMITGTFPPSGQIRSAVVAAAAAASNTAPQPHGVVIPTPHPYARKQPLHPFQDFNPLLPVRPPSSASYLPPIRLVAPQARSLSSTHSPERSPFLTPNLSSASSPSPTGLLALESPSNSRKRSFDEFMDNFDLNHDQYDTDRSASSISWTPSSQSAFCRTKRRCSSVDSLQYQSSFQQRSSLPSVHEILSVGPAQPTALLHTHVRSNLRQTSPTTLYQEFDDDFAFAQSRLRVDCVPTSNGDQVCVMAANSSCTSLRAPLALSDPHILDPALIRTPGPGTPVTPNTLTSGTTISPPPATPPENMTSPNSQGSRLLASKSNDDWMHNSQLISGLMAGVENAAAGVVITVNTPEDSRSIGKLLCFNSVVSKALPNIFRQSNVGEELSKLLDGDIVSPMLETVQQRSTSIMLKSKLMSEDVVVFAQRLDRLESQPNQRDHNPTTTTTTLPVQSTHSGYMWFFTLAGSARPSS